MSAVTPLPSDQWTDRQRELLAPVIRGADQAPNLFSTVVHNTDLYEAWNPFCLKLLTRSAFNRRERELVIMRVAVLCRADYEWGSHVKIARRAGLTDEELTRVTAPDVSEWPDDRERWLLRATDELLANHRMSGPTKDALSATCTLDQLIELPMLVGHYTLLAGLLNSWDVPLDSPDLPPLGSLDPEGSV